MARIACYCRVSTDDEDLARQVEATREFAVETLNSYPGDLELYWDKSTGTDTASDGYQRLMSDVDAGNVERITVKSVSCRWTPRVMNNSTQKE